VGQLRPDPIEVVDSHLSISHGSLAELETYIEIAKRVGYLEGAATDHFFSQSEEVGRMINRLRRPLRETRPAQGPSAGR
jgi:four helix bundle protein